MLLARPKLLFFKNSAFGILKALAFVAMLSPGRSSSCSPALSDGPDFLEFAVNHLSVDDESEFLLPVVEGKFGDGLSNASDHLEAKEEPGLENGASQDIPTQLQQQKEDENGSEENPSTETKTNSSAGCNERKSSADNKLPSPGASQETTRQLQQQKEDENGSEENPSTETKTNSSAGCNERKSSVDNKLPSLEQRKTSAEDLNTGKMSGIPGTSDLKINSKRPEAQGSFKELGAVTKSAAIWKGRVLTESRSHRFEISHSWNKRNSVRKLGDCSFLRNAPPNKDKYPNNQMRLGLYDVATNLYAKKGEFKRDSTLKSTRYLSLAERSGAKWLQNTVRSKKTELPPIDVVSRKRYSAHWIPQKSIPSYGKVNVLNEYSDVQRGARKQSDPNSIVLKSVLETLEATRLSGQNRVEVLKHSLASLSRNNNQANFKKKALPLVKSALAFKHHGNKSA